MMSLYFSSSFSFNCVDVRPEAFISWTNGIEMRPSGSTRTLSRDSSGYLYTKIESTSFGWMRYPGEASGAFDRAAVGGGEVGAGAAAGVVDGVERRATCP